MTRLAGITNLLPPSNEVWEVYVVTCICLSTGGRAWQGACMAEGHACHASPQQRLRDTVIDRAVRILLECILVMNVMGNET